MASLSPPGDSQLPRGTSGLTARHGEMIETLRDYAALQKNIHSLKRRDVSPPQDFQKWESLYVRHLSPLPFLITSFPQKAQRMEVTLPPPAREQLAQGCACCPDTVSGGVRPNGRSPSHSRSWQHDTPSCRAGSTAGWLLNTTP